MQIDGIYLIVTVQCVSDSEFLTFLGEKFSYRFSDVSKIFTCVGHSAGSLHTFTKLDKYISTFCRAITIYQIGHIFVANISKQVLYGMIY